MDIMVEIFENNININEELIETEFTKDDNIYRKIFTQNNN